MNSDTLIQLGSLLKSYREKERLTQLAMANYLHVSESLISKIENGHARIPALFLVRYCHAIGVSASEIISKLETNQCPQLKDKLIFI